ncbi:hypothetical protein, partial [Chromobacterium alticapitis]|uniref:hypothetical protein n=1 Tax=Chromobacterium alticapitis TaxID=2073169 RepID=UPI001E59C43A
TISKRHANNWVGRQTSYWRYASWHEIALNGPAGGTGADVAMPVIEGELLQSQALGLGQLYGALHGVRW